MNWHLLPLTEIAQLLNSSSKGLDSITASELLLEYGKHIKRN
ncbi:cation-transporting P-type ATPase [Flavobacterium laiguense]|uniref:Cation-transporting P-type ATPase N-terminal domain-containing protein n=1 Tax=Flavobacterium laiguense TaxID=2169409 RepID=A0A2U1JVE0_9FLAO|nr:hypothetical protein DB891_09510 [Flavobacterium laiguense]